MGYRKQSSLLVDNSIFVLPLIITLFIGLEQRTGEKNGMTKVITQHNCCADTNSVSTQYQSVSTPSWDHHGTTMGPILENFKDFHLIALVLLLTFLIFYNQNHTAKNLFQDGLWLSETEFSISPSKLVSE